MKPLLPDMSTPVTRDINNEIAESFHQSKFDVANDYRKSAFAFFEKTGLPTAKQEEYRFTPISKSLEKNFTWDSKESTSSINSIDAFLIPQFNTWYLVIFSNYLAAKFKRLFKIKLCQLCERAGADWVKTSTGYGFVKQADGSYNYKGATEHDLALMRAHVSAKVQVKAAGGVRDLDGLIKVRDLGGSRCGATATAAMMDDYRRREAAGTLDEGGGKIGAGGY